MTNPVLAEVARGPIVESWHRASAVVALPSGETVMVLGDADGRVYPRSAIKAFQALPLIAGGGAKRFSLSDEEIALICSSHNGEPAHVATARAILSKIGLGEDALGCGPHWPRGEAGRALAVAGGKAGPIHNNCSGKHIGMAALAVMSGWAAEGYMARDHRVQQKVAEAVEAVCGVPLAGAPCATDGCSVPTWAVPLGALATGFARFSNGEGLPDDLAAAAARIRAAVAAAPFMVAGTRRFCTGVMEITGPRAFVKTGAEGVMCAALPERNLGIAVKCDDGAARASELVMAHLLAAFGAVDRGESAFDRFLTVPVRNWNGIHTGDVRAAPALTEALSVKAGAMLA
ncbi:Hypothetical protein of L-Asparaginase type 2-like superfamily [hydrothermal vent metagenome]|uniref:Asparaginase n=1 Tax=hydrothermal vent metagenome TaxID=652676 RepID=A0A3B0TBN0_9ZZZZ